MRKGILSLQAAKAQSQPSVQEAPLIVSFSDYHFNEKQWYYVVVMLETPVLFVFNHF